ncbi:MAG: hypothetical protein JOZ13_14455 [Alphaproteobacteria bacterium]|nr:hypothetical protein [Alphaproteobacteria bacterium]
MIKKLICAGAFALAATGAQSGTPTKTYNIAIDGYCDTFQVSLDEVSGFIAAIRDPGSVCHGTNILAGVQALTEGGFGATFGETVNGKGYLWFFTSPVKGTGDVYLFHTVDGITEVLGSSSTYHIVHKHPVRHGGSSQSMMTSHGKSAPAIAFPRPAH